MSHKSISLKFSLFGRRKAKFRCPVIFFFKLIQLVLFEVRTMKLYVLKALSEFYRLKGTY